MIAEAVARLRYDLNLPADPTRRGPVPLDRFFEEFGEISLSHVALPGLTLGGVIDHLTAEGVPTVEIGEPTTTLAGFLFLARPIGKAFVNADDILPRRRFTAAHELGHAVLHRDQMGAYLADATISDSDEATTHMEREANQFAAELLMPEKVVRSRAEELKTELKIDRCPREVLEYRLAAELLVSAQAIRYRLNTLGVGDE